MERKKYYISTIDPNARTVAAAYGLGLEIAEFCTAWNLDDRFAETDAMVRRSIEGIPNRILHAPFNELFPCAIDPRARELARFRYRQAFSLAQTYGVDKVVIHGGYYPRVYFPCWYIEQSSVFWREELKSLPEGITICLENVLEEGPELLADIVKAVDDPRLRLCLDVGHANVCSGIPVMDWLEACAPYLSHVHIHNNDGAQDTHSALDQGSIPMRELLARAEKRCPDATYTFELAESEPSVRWLLEE